MRIATVILLCALLFSCAVTTSSTGQSGQPDAKASRRPKLIVGIVVDQMKPEFIERYWDDFGDSGFKRMVNGGYSASNLHYNYMPTYTGPGHAAVYTGTTPAFNGIVANDWFVRKSGMIQYCAKDTASRGVGSTSSAAQMSPVHLTASTLGDELRIFSSMQSRVVGIAMKDRGAILPAGRMANAAYWYIGGAEDKWATSDWYGMNELPQWVSDFNAKGKGAEYLAKGWSLLLPEESYSESMEDNNPYETPFKGITRPVFPYDLNALRSTNNDYDLIKATPWGNRMTVDFAKAALEGEQLGKRDVTDMLCVSFSSTDYVGHQFGIHSREIQDCYIRLDRDLGEFLSFLDGWVGKGEYVVFLTADHGGAPTPSFIHKSGSSASYFKGILLEEKVETFLDEKYGDAAWLINETNQNIFLNHAVIAERKLRLSEVQDEVAHFILSIHGVAESFAAHVLRGQELRSVIGTRVQLGFHQQLSGDVIYTLLPGWIEYGMSGTTHGSPYNYDTHVPALFYGFGVSPGETWRPQTICDIAPTIAAICRIPMPNASIGEPIHGLVK